MDISLDSRFFVSRKLAYRRIDDAAICYDFIGRKYVIFDSVSACVWEFIRDNPYSTKRDVIEKICEEYVVATETVEKDVNDLLGNLSNLRVVTTCSADYLVERGKCDVVHAQDIETEIVELCISKNTPFSFTFELTYNCNERCVHCYANYPKGYEEKQFLDVSVCNSVIQQLYSLGCSHINFTGGDPFMFRDFFKLLRIASKLDFTFDIYTNGLYLADHLAEANDIHTLNIRNYYISLYGATAMTHDSVTKVSGSFCKTIDTIKHLIQLGDSVVVNIMVLKRNKTEILKTIDFVKHLGAKYRIGFSVIAKNNGDQSPHNLFVDDITTIREIYNRENENIFSMGDGIEGILSSSKEITHKCYMCNAGISSLSMAPNGIVYPCISLKIPLGNIQNESIENIWLGKNRLQLISKMRMERFVNCTHCSYLTSCPHCPGISFQENGDMYSCNSCDKCLAHAFANGN